MLHGLKKQGRADVAAENEKSGPTQCGIILGKKNAGG